MRLLLATRSAHKVAEIRRILADVPGLDLVDLDEAAVPWTPEEEDLEPYESFEENARSKAAWFRARTGMATLADDSGLEVDALDGAPGVRSKRFAAVSEGVTGQARDDANNLHLLERLRGVPPAARTGRYVCVAVLDEGTGEARSFRGEAEGVILDRPRGAEGFGYDPLFLDPDLGHTYAEIPADAKHARSHRGRAFRALARHFAGGGA